MYFYVDYIKTMIKLVTLVENNNVLGMIYLNILIGNL